MANFLAAVATDSYCMHKSRSHVSLEDAKRKGLARTEHSDFVKSDFISFLEP